MNRSIRRVLFLVVVVGGGLAAYLAYQRHLARQPIEWTGTVEARTVELGSRVGGRVKNVLVREGDVVDAGQALVVLEPGDLEAQRLQAQGQLEEAEANLAKVAGHGSSARVQEIAAARARLTAEEIAVEKGQLDLSRTQQLVSGGAATRNELDNDQLALRNASAQRSAQQATLDQLLRGTPDDAKAAQGQVDVARGKVDQIQSAIDELVIRAPALARIETLDLRPGDILAPNAIAAKLLEPQELYVRIYVPETQLGLIHPAQEIPLYVDSFPERAFRAQVEAVNGEGEYTPRNLQTEDERADQVFAARLRLIDGRDLLRPGMAATARVPRALPHESSVGAGP